MAASGSYCLVLLAILHAAYSQPQTAAIPLWPCYSVHRLPNVTDPFDFRYVGVANCDCLFTLEGPPGSRLQLELHDVLLDNAPSPYGTGYPDCTGGAVRLFDFQVSGALALVTTACSSIQASPPVNTSTSMAVVTSTVTRGQFSLRVSVQAPPPENVTELVTPPPAPPTTTARVTPARLQQTTTSTSTTEAPPLADNLVQPEEFDTTEVTSQLLVETVDKSEEEESTDVPTTTDGAAVEDLGSNTA